MTSKRGWKRSREATEGRVRDDRQGKAGARRGRTSDDVLEVVDQALTLVDVVQSGDLDEPWKKHRTIISRAFTVASDGRARVHRTFWREVNVVVSLKVDREKGATVETHV